MRSKIIFIVAMLVAGMVFAQDRSNASSRRHHAGNRNRSGGAANAQKQETQPPTTRDDIKNAPRGTNGVPALAFNQAPLDLVLEA